MSVHQVGYDRNVDELVSAMAAWEPAGGHVAGLHVGDVGWHQRLPAEEYDDTVLGWWRDGRLVAAALIEGPAARPRIAPGSLDDPEVCGALADVLDALPAAEVWSDAQPGSLLRTLLVARGWQLDPDLWVALHVDLTRVQVPTVAGVDETGHDIDDRVTVQRNGFEGSTFTAEAWQRMASGPAFDPALDLVARDEDGTPVAGATAWSAGPGRCGVLEPVATHRDHRGRGHGRRIVRAALARLQRAGASGAGVCTPGTNTAANGLYASAGMRPVETLQALTRRRKDP